MSIEDLDRGDKREVHLHLFERELVILDALARKYQTSRAAIVGALLKDYVDAKKPDLTGKVPVSLIGAPRSRRAGAGRPAIMDPPSTDTFED